MEDRMIPLFQHVDLDEQQKERTSKVREACLELADKIIENCSMNPERTVALRKLLEAKDAAIRAIVFEDNFKH